MSAYPQAQCRNRLLALMSADDFALLAPDLVLVDFPKGFVIVEADGEITNVYFPETSIGSIVARSPEGFECEAGLFGCDGAGPLAAILGTTISPHRLIVQVPNGAYRIGRGALQVACDASATLRNLLLRYAQVMSVQTAYTALSNAIHPVDERLARWLLMCHDRTPTHEIAITHEFLSLMLAVRRPSVTTSLHVLEGNGFIRSERGSVTIRDRKGLEEFAGDSYGKPEAEYRRLIGEMQPSRAWL